jgi:hypothetical protein
MVVKNAEPTPQVLTAIRIARLYKLLMLIADGPQPRQRLQTRLKIDMRGFYRDLEALRGLGIEIIAGSGSTYMLIENLDDALARMPFPDPGLNVRGVLNLARGTSPAHRKLRQRIDVFLHTAPNASRPNKPR